MNKDELQTVRDLVDLRDRVLQKNRIAFSNRKAAAYLEGKSDNVKMFYSRWTQYFQDLENEADLDIKNATDELEIIQIMSSVRGVGPMLAAKVISMIDIQRATTISSLWKYAGYGVTDGVRDKPTKGLRLSYNKRLKATCYLVGTSFLKCCSPYRKIYDSAREYYEASRPEWTKAHQHNAAMRKMIKHWLAHLWLVWRELEGLPTESPYVVAYLKHEHVSKPEEYGWSH